MTRQFEQAQPTLSNADCVQMLVYHELTESLDNARINAAVLNFKQQIARPGTGLGIRLDRRSMLMCYREKADRPLSLAQFHALQTLMELWDQRTDLTEDSWLAYAMGSVLYETAGLSMDQQNMSYERAEELYGGIRGRVLGNTNPGDGWLYRARGMALVTGRRNYEQLQNALGYPLLEYPDLARNPEVSAQILFRFVFSRTRSLARYLNGEKQDWIGARKVYVWESRRSAAPIANEAKKFYECIMAARKR